MKVFSKNNNHNKSTPLLQSLRLNSTHKPPHKPKGITKITSYKNKLNQQSRDQPNNIPKQIARQQQPPKTERSKAETNYDWRLQKSVKVQNRSHNIQPVPMLLNSLSYKTCKTEIDQRSSAESIEKIENFVSYLTKPSKQSKQHSLNQTNSSQENLPQQKATLNLHLHKNSQKQQPLNIKKIYTKQIGNHALTDITDKENIISNSPPCESVKKRINYFKSIKNVEQQPKPMKKVCLSQFKIGKKLGRGRFGCVYSAEDKLTGMIVALKLIDLVQVKEQQMENQIIEEIKLQLYMNHPNILKMYSCFREDNQLCMILEYADQKCLFSKLEDPIEEKEAAYYAKQMIEALKYCHSQSILHRDLKPENILLCQGVAKLGDFGWAAYAPKYKRLTFCGTLDYVPPEILKGNFYDQKVDIWSLGVLIYQMSTGKAPFETYSIDHAHVEAKTMNRILEGDLIIPFTLSRELRKLITSILTTEPKKRPSLEQIESNTWIQTHKEEGTEIVREIWNFWTEQFQK